MSKKLIAVLIIALLVVSFAAARVINFQLGPSFSFFKGDTPVFEDPYTTNPYQGYGFGLDTAVDLTFGPKAELYFQDTVNVSTKSAFTKDPTNHEFDTFTLNYKTHAGFEFAVLTDPVKLSVGGGLALEIVSTIYHFKIEDEDVSLVVLDMNMGLGATVKAEFPLANHWSVYVRAFVDYFPVAGFAMGAGGEKEPYSCAGRVNNFSVDASAGIVLYF
jgi:hypothetical protein